MCVMLALSYQQRSLLQHSLALYTCTLMIARDLYLRVLILPPCRPDLRWGERGLIGGRLICGRLALVLWARGLCRIEVVCTEHLVPVLPLEDPLDHEQNLGVEDNVQVGQAPQLFHMDRLLLLACPALAQAHAPAVHCIVTVTVNHVHWVGVGELVIVHVGDRCGEPHSIEAVHLHARWGQSGGDVSGVLPHVPAILKVDVLEEALVVLVGVVERGGGDEGVVLWPGFLWRDHPWVGGGHPLLLSDLYVGHQRDAIVLTYTNHTFTYSASSEQCRQSTHSRRDQLRIPHKMD